MKVAKVVLSSIALILASAQFVRPARTNPALSSPLAIDDRRAESILRRSCFDCHSNETRWPWYSGIAPMSWQVVGHVDHGRSHLNFSAWNKSQSAKLIQDICEEVENGEMPIRSYLLMHPHSKLSAGDLEALCAWSNRAALQAADAAPRTSRSEYPQPRPIHADRSRP